MVKFSVVGTGYYWAVGTSFFTDFLSYKILYVWLVEKTYDSHLLYIYYISQSVLVLYDSHLLRVNIEHLVACWWRSWKLVLFHQITERGGVHYTLHRLCSCGVWTENIMINWTLPGVSKKPGIIWLKYFKWFTLYLNFSTLPFSLPS